MDKNDIFIVIPAYNEEKMIKNTLQKLKSSGYENIIVIDDGSRDKTYKLAVSEDVIVCKHLINRGLGGALKTGLKCALKYNPRVVVTFDADGQHDPEDIVKVSKPIIDEGYDVIVGSRLIDENELKNMPFVKKIGNWGLNFITYLMGGSMVTDSQGGLRAFSLNTAEIISKQLKSNRYEVSSEFIVLFNKNKLKLKEVPIKTIYTEYSMARGTNVITGFKILFKLIIQKLI